MGHRYSALAVLLFCVFHLSAAHAEDRYEDEVIVTASRVPEPGYSVGSAFTVLTRDQLEQRQARFVADALRAVPGIAVNRSGPPGNLTQLRLRGSEANMTLVVVDGVEMNDPGNFDSGFNFADLLANDIERIEVVRGAQSAIWGSDAIGGVINIVTRRGDGPLAARASFERGSLGTRQLDASLSAGSPRYDFALSGIIRESEGISAADKALGNTERDPYDNRGFSGRLGFAPSDIFSITVLGGAKFSRLAFDDPPFDSANITKTYQQWGHADARLTLFDGMIENITAANLAHLETKSDFSGFPGSSNGSRQSLSNQINVKLKSHHPVAIDHRLTFYAERERERGQISFAGGNEPRITHSTGLAAEYALGVAERYYFTAGVRHDMSDRFPSYTSYRLTGAVLIPSTNLRLHASYGTGLKQPTLIELFGFGTGFKGNPDLDPETSKSADVGLEARFWNDRLRADVTLFRNDIDNRILGAGPMAVNIPGLSRSQGVEVEANALLLDWLRLDLSYTGMRTEDPDGFESIRRPRHTGSVTLNADLWEGRGNINIGLDYNGRQRDTDFSNFILGPQAVDLEPYTLLRIGAQYEIYEGIRLMTRVENALDQDYQDVLFYGTPGITAYGGIRIDVGG